jgi:hypothetical protein
MRRRRQGHHHSHDDRSLVVPSLDRKALIALCGVPLLGAALCVVATRYGVAVLQDSAAYFGSAENLIHGRGLTTPFDVSESTLSPQQVYSVYGAVPLVHWPPVYSVVLAFFSLIGISIKTAARWLDVALIFGNLLVFELLVRKVSRSNLLVPVATAALLLAGPGVIFGVQQDFFSLHTYALSEPLFLLVFLLAIVFLNQYAVRPNHQTLLALLICVALAPMIRWVGFGLVVGAAAVAFLWFPRIVRVTTTAYILLCGFVPAGAWSLFQTYLLHGGSARAVAWHPPRSILQDLLNQISGWFLPPSLPEGVRWGLLFILVGAVTFLLVRFKRSDSEGEMIKPILFLVVIWIAYLAVVLITMFLLDATLPPTNRIMLPLIPLFYVIVVSTLCVAWRAWWMQAVVAGLCLLAAIPAIGPTSTLVANGPALGAPNRATAQAMQIIEKLPKRTVIASGIGDQIYLDANRSSIRVPVQVEATTARMNPYFFDQVRQLAVILYEHDGILVWMPSVLLDFVTTGATPADFQHVATLRPVRQLPDHGAIYRVVSLTPLDNALTDR